MVKAYILIAAATALSTASVHAQDVTLFGQFNLGGKPLLQRVCPKITSGLLRGTTGPVKEVCWEDKPFNHNGERAGVILLPYALKQTLPVWAENAKVSAIYLGQNLGNLQLVFDSKYRMEALKSVGERFKNPSYVDREHGDNWSQPDVEIQVLCSGDECYAVFTSAEYRAKQIHDAEAKAKITPPRARTP